MTEKLATNFERKHFSEQAGDGVPELALNVGESAGDDVTVWNCLKPSKLDASKAAVFPMEGPDGRARLRGERPGAPPL